MSSTPTTATRPAGPLPRLRQAATERPEFGRATTATSVCELHGLRTVVHEKTFTLETDLAPAFGGGGAAPSPTVLVRAALGACLAAGYQLHAADLGIELRSVRVTVTTESDVRGMLFPDTTTPAGFTGVSYLVEIDSPAPAASIEQLVERSDRLSPVLDALTRANPIARHVVIGPLDAPEER